jgi:hypothetical protein
MPSFLDLPAETRMAVYNILLNCALTKNTRILYTGDNPFRCVSGTNFVRHKLSYNIKQDQIAFIGNQIIKTQDIIDAECHIHRADVDDLLSLATTCRLLRSELLALAWSNADISVSSPTLTTDLHCIFYNRLSTNACNFVRNLQVKIEECSWSREEMRNIAGLIRRRLPQLEQLIVNIPNRSAATKQKAWALWNVMPVLRAILSHVALRFKYYCVPSILFKYSRSPEQIWDWNKIANEHFEAIRAEVGPTHRGRRDKLAKREQKDQVADVLEATVELRPLGIL